MSEMIKPIALTPGDVTPDYVVLGAPDPQLFTVFVQYKDGGTGVLEWDRAAFTEKSVERTGHVTSAAPMSKRLGDIFTQAQKLW